MANQWTYRPLRERFYSQCEAVTESGCWIWMGPVGHRCYGFIKENYRTRLAHRVSWELHNGPVPDGLHVCHRCDVPECVNPTHLFVGTGFDNMRDKVAKGRQHRPRGELSGMAKLDDDAVRYIRSSSDTGRALAAKFGVTPSVISVVRNFKRWTHV